MNEIGAVAAVALVDDDFTESEADQVGGIDKVVAGFLIQKREQDVLAQQRLEMLLLLGSQHEWLTYQRAAGFNPAGINPAARRA